MTFVVDDLTPPGLSYCCFVSMILSACHPSPWTWALELLLGMLLLEVPLVLLLLMLLMLMLSGLVLPSSLNVLALLAAAPSAR